MGCFCSPAVKSSELGGFMKQFSMENPITKEQLDKLEKDYGADEKVKLIRKVPDVTSMDMVNLTRDQVKNMRGNLVNLKLVLELAFTKIKCH